MKPIKKLTFYINTDKVGAEDLCEKLAKQASSIGTEYNVCKKQEDLDSYLKDQEVCCVIGGDGTILGTVNACIKTHIPIFGVNQGKLGFLATFSPKTALSSFISILKGEYQLKERFLLECTTANGKKGVALNDVVVKHYSPSRLMTMEVYCDEQFVTAYSSDGLIIATPTGSTAYNLSAGGPIIHPGANVFAMTPICPHTLSNRSVIFSNNKILTVVTTETDKTHDNQVQISLDGQIPWNEPDLFPIKVTVAPKTVTLLQPLDYSHFDILRKKLKWGD